MRNKLYSWQEECLMRWLENGGRGVVNVVTGAGKTVLALAAIERLRQTRQNVKVYIVVPKNFLAAQWARALREELDIPHGDIGLFSGHRKDPPSRAFMIYVVNSARYAISRHIYLDIQAARPVLLIADECHHYGTAENGRIFGFMGFITRPELYYSLGLSATPYSENFKTVLVPALGREIYHYGFEEALQAGIINPFTIFNIALSFHADERDEYDNYSEILRNAMRELKEVCPHLRGLSGNAFFAQLVALSASADKNLAELARTVRLLIYRRKQVVYRAKERFSCVLALIDYLPPPAKVVIFTERIETTNIIFTKLKKRVKGGVGLYHSGMSENARNNTITRFQHGEIRVLVSCKALDEGFNVPEADVGIIMSATNSDRQRIQRLGRVLRKKSGGESRLYYLYVENSTEEVTLLHTLAQGASGVPIIDMAYYDGKGFNSPSYDALAALAAAYMRGQGWSLENIWEVERNIELGRLSCEWLLSEDTCRERIAQAETRAEKNYYVTMRLLASVRERNLE